MGLHPRQTDDDPDNLPDGYVMDSDGVARPWTHSETGYIIKWSIIAGLILVVGLYLLLSYLHAQRRLRRGLTPRKYHRWMVSKRELARINPHYAYPQANYMSYGPPPAYGMDPVPPPPVYQPSGPGSKVDPAQGRDVKAGFEPPPGPPPGRME